MSLIIQQKWHIQCLQNLILILLCLKLSALVNRIRVKQDLQVTIRAVQLGRSLWSQNRPSPPESPLPGQNLSAHKSQITKRLWGPPLPSIPSKLQLPRILPPVALCTHLKLSSPPGQLTRCPPAPTAPPFPREEHGRSLPRCARVAVVQSDRSCQTAVQTTVEGFIAAQSAARAAGAGWRKGVSFLSGSRQWWGAVQLPLPLSDPRFLSVRSTLLSPIVHPSGHCWEKAINVLHYTSVLLGLGHFQGEVFMYLFHWHVQMKAF